MKNLLATLHEIIDYTDWKKIAKESSMEKQIGIRAELVRAERKVSKALEIPSRY